jgi:multidrug efflux pump
MRLRQAADRDPMMKSFNLSEWAVKTQTFVLFLIVLALVAGGMAFHGLGRSEDPQFNVPVMSVMMAWPGATSEQVQNQVLNRVENKLREVDHVKAIQSFSRQNYGGLLLEMKGGMSDAELKDAWYQARKKISDIRSEFPPGVSDPIYNDEYSDIYTVLYAVQGKGLSYAELLNYANDIKRGLQAVPNTKKIDIFGQQKQQIFVEFSSRKLASLQLSPSTIINALSQQDPVASAGIFETKSDRVFVRIGNSLKNAKDVGQTPIRVGSTIVHLRDIATIRSGYQDPKDYEIRFNAKRTLVIGLTMQQGSNVLNFSQDLDAQMIELRKSLPVGVNITKIADQPKVVESSIGEFEKSFLEALVIVLIISFIALGFRSGLVVATSIPLVLAIVAVIMKMNGWDLDRVTLGALIISLGLLVDDAIIAVEMMQVKMEAGWDRIRAASFAYSSTAFPMLTGTLITVAGFMPVGLAKSDAGTYASGIFWILSTALIVSWLVAVVFTPYLGFKLLPDRHSNQGKHQYDPYDRPIFHYFKRVIAIAIHRKWVVIGITLGLFVAALLGMTVVQQQFFPVASRLELHVTLTLRPGSSFAATEADVKRLEKMLKNNPDIQFYTSYIGKSSPQYYLSAVPELPNASYAQMVILTKDLEARERVRTKLLKLFSDGRHFPDAFGQVKRLEFGPPVKYAISFRVKGPDTNKLRDIAYQVQSVMRKERLVKDTLLEWNEKSRNVNINVNQEKAAMLGISKKDLADTIQVMLGGISPTTIPKGEDQVEVVVRADRHERQSIESLGQVVLFTRNGGAVPLSQIATITPGYEDPVLWRYDRKSYIGVSADVADGVQAPDASAKIDKQLDKIRSKLPVGYEIEMAGAVAESDAANMAIVAVVPIMVMIILLLLMAQLHSFSKSIMVFLTAPLGLIGVVPALLIFGSPFGFVALIGVIALAGMVMRNSVILVDQISQDEREGSYQYEAIIEATTRRARPVILTAAAAMLGMYPLTKSLFWGPMAIAIMGGLFVGTLLTLVFVPALYAAWFKVEVHENDHYMR